MMGPLQEWAMLKTGDFGVAPGHLMVVMAARISIKRPSPRLKTPVAAK
jgi:hypothetical protein